MNELSFVAAAYAVVLGGLLAYGISLARRGRAATRRLSAIESSLEHPPAQPGVAATVEPETEANPRSS